MNRPLGDKRTLGEVTEERSHSVRPMLQHLTVGVLGEGCRLHPQCHRIEDGECCAQVSYARFAKPTEVAVIQRVRPCACEGDWAPWLPFLVDLG